MPVVPSKVVLSGLTPVLVDELHRVLISLGVEVAAAGDAGAHLAFCDAGHVGEFLNDYPELPVVAVSSQREVADWLDAMEAGASDYCTAPFEAANLGWILKSNLRPSVKQAA